MEAGTSNADAGAWIFFLVVVAGLAFFDVTCLHPPITASRISFATAAKLTVFWVVVGFVFDLFILAYLGWEAGVGYLQGYFLEYMLSFDNLFVFHLVFSYYCTPEALLYRALYFGIAGAIVFRIVFLFVGYTFMQSGLYVVKLLFGAILIWSGIRSANDMDDEDTADPTNNPFITWVTKHLPVSDNYEPHGHFFVTVAEVECRPPRSVSENFADERPAEEPPSMVEESSAVTLPRLESFEGSSLLQPVDGPRGSFESSSGAGVGPGVPAVHDDRSPSVDSDSFAVMRKPARLKRKASLLFLVIIALIAVDVVFAVDSVASKLASVNDIFLNTASAAFAMLSMRSLYFVMEHLVHMFQMLKYGIAAILVLIGLKLVFTGIADVSSTVTFTLVLLILAASIASSYWMPRFRETCEHLDMPSGGLLDGDDEEVEEGRGLSSSSAHSRTGLFDRRPEESAPLTSPGRKDSG